MATVGGDAPALFNFASQLIARRSAIEAAEKRLSEVVQHANWTGSDRDRFVNTWNSEHRPALLNVCSELASASTRVRNAAQAQENVSS